MSKAREFEDYKRLPKFNHVPMAVIHPSPVKKRAPPKRPEPDLEVEASPQRLVKRPNWPPVEIPESLVRPPQDMNVSTKTRRPKSAVGFGSTQPRFGGPSMHSRGRSAGNAKLLDEQKKAAEKQKVAMANLKLLFDAIKSLLDGPEDAAFLRQRDHSDWPVREAKVANQRKTLFKQIYSKALASRDTYMNYGSND